MSDEAAAFLRARRRPIEMVIFDCDGVLIDSEGLCNRVCAALLTEQGWPMTGQECHDRFIGLSFPAMQPMIEAELGRSLGAGWVDQVVAAVTAAMTREVEAMPGARAALDAVTGLGLPWRIASNSSHTEMHAKFTRVGWSELVAGRTHSGIEVAAPKPAPDVFLAAAAAERIDPLACLVIEDSVAGATAARAARMDCLGLAPEGDDSGLRAVGAVPFRAMGDLGWVLAGARPSSQPNTSPHTSPC